MPGPYLIAEAFPANSYQRGVRDGKFHLLPAERASRTFCGREVANGTMIPLDEWGGPGATWCATCRNRRARAAEEVGPIEVAMVAEQ